MKLHSRKLRKHNNFKNALIAWTLRIGLIATIIWFIWIQNNLLVVNSYIYSDLNIPKQLVGYNIVHISDINNSNIDVAKKVKHIKPDVIVLTGGYTDKDGKYNNTINTINKLSEIAPVYYIYNISDEIGILSNTNAVNITNTNVELQRNITDAKSFIEEVYGKDIIKKANNGDEQSLLYIEYINELLSNNTNSKINLIGIDNFAYENGQYDARDKVYELLLKSDSQYSLALMGNIDILDEVCKTNTDIIMFGGTFGTNLISSTYTKGIYANNGTQLFVSSGVGKTDGVTRFMNFPSIQSITLSDGTIQDKNPLEKFMGSIIKDVGTVFDNDEGFEIYTYKYGE